MVSKTTDRGNNDGGAICFLFLACRIFQESSIEMDVKNCQCYCKKQIESLFSLGISNEPPWASYVYFLEPTFFFVVFTERNSLCVCLYQTSKLYHKPGLTTLAFALSLFKSALISW